jgi:hypothetical protein
MENQFVSYELALRMKQLGFDEPCFGYYDMGQKFNFPGCTMNNRNFINLKTTMAPLFQQAFRWFREKYDLHYQLIPFFSDKESHAVDYYLALAQHRPPIQVKTYEEAELACLTKLIEIVEQKNEK